MKNPFVFGNPVDSKKFLNRQKELRWIVSRIESSQSFAVVSEPRMGKTSLLEYIRSDINRSVLSSKKNQRQLLFSFIDAQTLTHNFSQAEFWGYSFNILETIRMKTASKDSISTAYRICKESGFTTFNLERLLAQMEIANLNLIILIDEFDSILFNKGLNKPEFYGSLRSLASRYTALTIIIASRRSLSDLNISTMQYSRAGSPYFNFMQEITLDSFSQKTADELLDLAGGFFTALECRFIKSIAGGHPYLLQAAASCMWEAHTEKIPTNIYFEHVANQLRKISKLAMQDTWQVWTPEERKAFTVIALDEMPRMLGERDFDLVSLRAALDSYPLEIRHLVSCGFISSDSTLPTGWKVNAQIMSWWLADVLILALRDNDDLGKFLQEQQWDGYFTKGEKMQLAKFVKWVGEFAKTGIETFIKVGIESIVKSAS